MAAVASRVSWADSEDTPMTGGASSSATRPRWADIAEEDEGEATAAKTPQQPAEVTCGNAPRDAEDADSNCSTSACSDHDADALREERFADLVASDEEEPPTTSAAAAAPPQGASSSAVAASSTQWVPRRAGKGGGGASASAAAAPTTHKGHHRGQWHSAQWNAQWHGWWKDNGAAAQGRWESRKEASWQQPRGGKGKQKSQGTAGKRQCQFTIGIEEEPDFRVVRRLLGMHGKHVKRIAEESGAKLRLRGRGSGFKEGPEQEESRDPLMLCVSAPDARSYDVAVRLLREHLEEIYEQHRSMFPSAGCYLQIDLHEGPREGSF